MKKETQTAAVEKVIKGIAIKLPNKTFYYNFDLLTIDRILAGEQLFKMYLKSLDLIPNKDNINSMVSQQIYRHAMSAILPEQYDDKTFEVYIPEQSSSYISFMEIKGIENYKKMNEIENDFFTNIGIVSTESITLLQNIIKDMEKPEIEKLSSLMKEVYSGQLNV